MADNQARCYSKTRKNALSGLALIYFVLLQNVIHRFDKHILQS